MMKEQLLVFSIAVVLVACGGSTKNSSTPQTDSSDNNVAPVVTDVTVKDENGGQRMVGDILTAQYSYSDIDNDLEGETTFQWLRDDGNILTATNQKYTLTTQDVGRVITVSVTPLARSGVESGVAVVSVNKTELASSFTPTDPLISDQWYLNNTGIVPSNWGDKLTKVKSGADQSVVAAWQKGVTGKGVTVTVVDDGIDFSHPDLTNQENEGHSYAFDEGNESVIAAAIKPAQDNPIQASERNDHGTSCAGIIAAESNNIGVVGIAPESSLVGLRLLGVGNSTESASNNLASRILNAGVSTVSNHSYGSDDNGLLHPQSVQDYNIYKALAEGGGDGSSLKDHVILVAAGNGRDIGDYAGLDMAQQNPYILSISGFTASDTDVSYAEAGPATLVAGATGDEDKGYPRIATTGRTSENYNRTDKDLSPYHFDSSHRMNNDKSITSPMPLGYTASFNGSSAAAPAVAGVAALIRSANPELSWRDVRWILARTARKIQLSGNTANEVIDSGVTVPLWSTGGNEVFGKFSHHFGYGAVDAGAAVGMALDPGYTVLPDMKTCEIEVTGSSDEYSADPSVISTDGDCPSVIEFVQIDIKQTITQKPRDVSKMQLNLVYGASVSNTEKVARLLVPTTCNNVDEEDNDIPCEITNTTSWQAGTTAYMGDELKVDGSKKFFFSELNSQANDVPHLVPQKITVYGF